MSRRQFLQQLAAMGISTSLPALSLGAGSVQSAHPRHLVLVELNGGNDGLNNVIPYRDANYYTLRPSLGIKPDSVMQLTDNLGLNPALKAFYPLWEQGDLALVNGVGYPDPNRSHFRSIEIWETASDANETLLDGWLTPIADTLPSRNDSGIKAVALANDQGPLSGDQNNTVVFDNLGRFLRQAKGLKQNSANTDNAALQHVLQVQDSTRKAARDFARNLSQLPKLSTDFPKTKFSTQLSTIARLIQSNAGPQIYKISHGSFDTHANQFNVHNNLLRELSRGLAAFRNALQQKALWNDVVVMTYSEFGRRANENASKGTDHGTAAVQYVMGGRIKGGMYGEQPSLASLVDGDMQYTTDFRSLYKTIASEWLEQTTLPSRLDGFEKIALFG